jgi:hypothetical protein
MHFHPMFFVDMHTGLPSNAKVKLVDEPKHFLCINDALYALREQ